MCPSDREGVGSWVWRSFKVYMTVFLHVALPPGSIKIFHTHLGENLARSFQNVFGIGVQRVLNLVFSRN